MSSLNNKVRELEKFDANEMFGHLFKAVFAGEEDAAINIASALELDDLVSVNQFVECFKIGIEIDAEQSLIVAEKLYKIKEFNYDVLKKLFQEYFTLKKTSEAERFLFIIDESKPRNDIWSWILKSKIAMYKSDFDKAEELSQQAMIVAEKRLKKADTLPSKHDAILSYENMSLMSKFNKEYSNAIDYFKKAHAIALSIASDTNERYAWDDMTISYINLGELFEQSGNEESAREQYSNAISIQERYASEEKDSNSRWFLFKIAFQIAQSNSETRSISFKKEFYAKCIEIAEESIAMKVMFDEWAELGMALLEMLTMVREEDNIEAEEKLLLQLLDAQYKVIEEGDHSAEEIDIFSIAVEIVKLEWRKGDFILVRKYSDLCEKILIDKNILAMDENCVSRLFQNYLTRAKIEIESGDNAQCIAFCNKALIAAEKIEQADSDMTMSIKLIRYYSAIAEEAEKAGDEKLALQLYKKAVISPEKLIKSAVVEGKTPVETFRYYLSHGKAFLDERNKEKAQECFMNALKVSMNIQGADNSDDIIVDRVECFFKLRSIIGTDSDSNPLQKNNYSVMLNFLDALKEDNDSLELKFRKYDVFFQIADLAYCYDDKESAKKYYAMWLKLRIELEEYIDIVETRQDFFVANFNLIELCKKEGDIAGEVACAEFLTTATDEIVGLTKDNDILLECSFGYYMSAKVAEETENLSTAKECYKKALDIASNASENLSWKSTSREFVICCNKLAEIAKKESDFPLAIHYLKKLLCITENLVKKLRKKDDDSRIVEKNVIEKSEKENDDDEDEDDEEDDEDENYEEQNIEGALGQVFFICNDIAICSKECGNLKEVIEHYKKAVNAIKEVFDRSGKSEARSALNNAYTDLVFAALKNDNDQLAKEIALLRLRLLEDALLQENSVQIYKELVFCSVQLNIIHARCEEVFEEKLHKKRALQYYNEGCKKFGEEEFEEFVDLFDRM